MLVEKIKGLCYEKNMTIYQLEKALCFGNGTVHKWGSVKPSADKVLRIAKFFDVPLEYLFDENLVLSNEGMELAKKFDKFSVEQRHLIMKTLSSLSDNGNF